MPAQKRAVFSAVLICYGEATSAALIVSDGKMAHNCCDVASDVGSGD